MTQLAIQICAHLTPKPPLPQLPDHQPSSFDSGISDSDISDPSVVPVVPSSRRGEDDSPPDAASETDRFVASSLRGEAENQQCSTPAEVHEDYPIPAVLFIGGREASETIRARLAAAGADLRRILILTEVTDTDTAYGDEIKRPLKVSDYKLIGEVLHEHKGIRLVIIDNAEDLFFDTNRIKRNRLLRQLACFRALAESREVNVCLLANIPRLDNDPFRTTLLSTLREVCRTVHLLTPDLPQDSADPSLTSDLPNNPRNPSRRKLHYLTSKTTRNSRQHRQIQWGAPSPKTTPTRATRSPTSRERQRRTQCRCN